MDVIARFPGCHGQAADAASAHTQVKLEDAPRLLKIPKSECPDVWIRLPRHKWPKFWANIGDPVVPLERNLYGHPLAGLSWTRYFEQGLLELGWEKSVKLGMLTRSQKNKNYSCGSMCMISQWLERSRIWLPCGRNWWKSLILTNQLHFLITYTWEVLNVNANRMNSAGATEKSPGWEKPHAQTVARSYDMEGHARKCVERYCELANKTTQQFTMSQHHALRTTKSRKKNSFSFWRIFCFTELDFLERFFELDTTFAIAVSKKR